MEFEKKEEILKKEEELVVQKDRVTKRWKQWILSVFSILCERM